MIGVRVELGIWNELMSTSMLVIGGSGKLESLCIAAYPSEDVQLVFASDISSAKRCLVKKTPAVIICSEQVIGGSDAIIELSEQLKEHPVFSQVPFLVVTSGDGLIYGDVNGIKGIINPALSPEDFVRRIQNVIRGIITKEIPEVKASINPADNNSNVVKKGDLSTDKDLLAAPTVGECRPVFEDKNVSNSRKASDTGDMGGLAGKAKESSTVFDEDFLKKINLAQRILAKVFVNLKSSSLLQIVELEDVPRVVFEITRTVCGVPSEDEPAGRIQTKREQSVSDQAKHVHSHSKTGHSENEHSKSEHCETSQEIGVEIDLDRVFRTK